MSEPGAKDRPCSDGVQIFGKVDQMAILKSIIALIVLAVAAVLVLAAMQPDEFIVSRSLSIDAPPEKVFPLIDNLHSFALWSPYEKKDPEMKRAFLGPEAGKGAIYDWDGNGEVGSGRLEIIESVPPSKVRIALDMKRPLEASNTVTFTLQPKGNATEVTWMLEGKTPFIGKIMHVLMNIDRMVGRDFEEGLASLKSLAEKA
jgi:uncharacterized protein YndB with AHSA1/START domain